MTAGVTSFHSFDSLGTVITIAVPNREPHDVREAVSKAEQWFRDVHATCTRFDPSSELRQLCETHGVDVRPSDMLFEIVRFAIDVARVSNGAFDPTMGAEMIRRGFDREYRTGAAPPFDHPVAADVSWRDVMVDAELRTVRFARPLLLDLGAIAKGCALDLAAIELQPFVHYAIDAGGDLVFAGQNADGKPWSAGVRDPGQTDRLVGSLTLGTEAVCTSGGYFRANDSGHHLVDPRTRLNATDLASVTVVSPRAMVADAMSTAAFVLGAEAGRTWLESTETAAVLVRANGDVSFTGGAESRWHAA